MCSTGFWPFFVETFSLFLRAAILSRVSRAPRGTRLASWTGSHLFCYACCGSCELPEMPHKGVDVWHPRMLQTPQSMHSCAHEVRQGDCDPPKTPHVSPLAWHPRQLIIIPAHVARCPATLSMVESAGGVGCKKRRSLSPCIQCTLCLRNQREVHEKSQAYSQDFLIIEIDSQARL